MSFHAKRGQIALNTFLAAILISTPVLAQKPVVKKPITVVNSAARVDNFMQNVFKQYDLTYIGPVNRVKQNKGTEYGFLIQCSNQQQSFYMMVDLADATKLAKAIDAAAMKDQSSHLAFSTKYIKHAIANTQVLQLATVKSDQFLDIGIAKSKYFPNLKFLMIQAHQIDANGKIINPAFAKRVAENAKSLQSWADKQNSFSPLSDIKYDVP